MVLRASPALNVVWQTWICAGWRRNPDDLDEPMTMPRGTAGGA